MVEVHDLHIWQITSGQNAVSAHVIVDDDADCHTVRRNLEDLLRSEYGLSHSTLQVDHSPEATSKAASSGEHCEEPHGPVHRLEPHVH